jgi:hypothetical protein
MTATGLRNEPATPRRLVCARCGASFDCGLGGECWCAAENFRMSMPAVDAAEDCLCPPCLRAHRRAQAEEH